MRKAISFALISISICLFMFSCDNGETYADKLKKEKKAIKRIVNDSNFVFMKDYPENGIFKSNEFFLDPNSGVYMQVIDSGNGRRAQTTSPATIVNVRYQNAYSLYSTDSIHHSNMTAATLYDVINFTYGDQSTYTGTYSSGSITSDYRFKSLGVVAPLRYVGDSAIVKLIIPFSCGSTLQQQTYDPVYIGYLMYSFRKEQGE